ncbi:hypothetical protein BDV23DRAFT_157853 [Aspergillus alliaceus]|uniref:C6 and C2H2 transcription factor n=1 Tax=Petromyces alliaceus TaxID=209559 RepID=A0A5N7C4G0_PETAA|nr:hypothetical protein BDV23DRAFT_157853 [Aspergillus alliaceus]
MPPRTSSDPLGPPFQCSYPECRAQYRRKEHLNRHVANHAQGDRFSCPYCKSTLTRSDLLRRHIWNYHPGKQPLPSRTRKACSTCHIRKTRCNGGSPCNACQRRGVTCSLTENGNARDGCNLNKDISDLQRPPDIQVGSALPKSNISNSTSDVSRWVAHDYVDIYFKVFHPVWPFIHQGTFDLPKEPCILIQSIVMIGLWIEGGQNARDAAVDLHHKLCTAIRAQMDQWFIPESRSLQNTSTCWPMATYQSVLLQVIFALLNAKEQTIPDLSFRYRLQPDEYELLVRLVQSCRRLGMFIYPNMLAQHGPTAPLALVWVNVEEIKRFGLALYKVCRMCTRSDSAGGDINGAKCELLGLHDLLFCLPDSDEVWNAPFSIGSEILQKVASQTNLRDNRDSKGWISQTSTVLHDTGVAFEWI